MITDPKTAPRGPRARLVYAVSLGLLGALLIAPTTTEFASKVALLGSLAIVCLALPVLRALPRPLVQRRARVSRCRSALALYAGALVLVTSSAPATAAATAIAARDLPPIQIVASSGVQSQLDRATARSDRDRARHSRCRRPARGRSGCGSCPAPTRARRSRSRSSAARPTACIRWPAAAGRSARTRSRSRSRPRRAVPSRRATASQNIASSVGPRLPAGLVPLRDVERLQGDDGRRRLLARLQQRRLARSLRRQLVLERGHGALAGARRAAADGALRERARAVP